MFDDLATGKIAVAYNVLGSYASARKDAVAQIEVILPSDFPTTMMRTAFVSRGTALPELGRAFIRHLTDLQSDPVRAATFPLSALDQSGQPTITLDPALMTYLDSLKRRTFLQEWESAIIQ